MKCTEMMERLERLAPLSMACDWDNPGLLAGRSDKEVKTVFLAVDATDEVIDQAEAAGADLLLTHHPLIFKAIRKINDGDFIGRRLLRLIQKDISYYAMHTNFDAAPGCMGDLAGDRLGLSRSGVLEPMGESGDGVPYGIGVYGELPSPCTLRELAEQVKRAFSLPAVTVYGDVDSERKLCRAAICPGAGGGTVQEALRCGAQVYITGDISHHTGIDAVAGGMAVIDAGHYGIEHIFMDFMADFLKEEFGDAFRVEKAAYCLPNHTI